MRGPKARFETGPRLSPRLTSPAVPLMSPRTLIVVAAVQEPIDRQEHGNVLGREPHRLDTRVMVTSPASGIPAAPTCSASPRSIPSICATNSRRTGSRAGRVRRAGAAPTVPAHQARGIGAEPNTDDDALCTYNGAPSERATTARALATIAPGRDTMAPCASLCGTSRVAPFWPGTYLPYIARRPHHHRPPA